MGINMENLITTREAAQIEGLTKQAVFKCISKGIIKGYKINGIWHVDQKEYKEYLNNRFSRERSIFKGEKKFDISKGELSLRNCNDYISKQLGFELPYQRLYYLVHTGQLRAHKKGSSWIIMIEEADRYVKEFSSFQHYIKNN